MNAWKIGIMTQGYLLRDYHRRFAELLTNDAESSLRCHIHLH